MVFPGPILSVAPIVTTVLLVLLTDSVLAAESVSELPG